MQDVMEKYKKLIEYLKSDYLRGTLNYGENSQEYDQLKNYVEEIFNIEISHTQINLKCMVYIGAIQHILVL